MNITIIGPGAIGVSLACSLAKNNTVSLLVKQQHNNLVKKGKISVKEISGKIIDKEIVIIINTCTHLQKESDLTIKH